jgi:hypothetical protein
MRKAFRAGQCLAAPLEPSISLRDPLSQCASPNGASYEKGSYPWSMVQTQAKAAQPVCFVDQHGQSSKLQIISRWLNAEGRVLRQDRGRQRQCAAGG